MSATQGGTQINLEERRGERVRRLLNGESLSLAEFGYDIEGWHLAAVATGTGAEAALRALATTLDRLLLAAPGDDGTTWAWFGGRHQLGPTELQRLVALSWPPSTNLAIGEPAEGISGWRLTHRQAQVAMTVARLKSQPIVSYADVAVAASIREDELLVMSLHRRFLAPLEAERDGGKALRETLRAYLAAGLNAKSAAAALGVDRRTVHNRLGKAEELIGRPPSTATTEIDLALCLYDLTTVSGRA